MPSFPKPFPDGGPPRPALTTRSATPTSWFSQDAGLDLEWPVPAAVLDACQMVLLDQDGPPLIVEPAHAPATTRVVERAPDADTPAETWLWHANPAREAALAAPPDFGRWSATLAARRASASEPRRAGMAVLGGLSCALLAYVDLTMAPRNLAQTPATLGRDSAPAALVRSGFETHRPDGAGRVELETRAQVSRLSPGRGPAAKTAMPTARRVPDVSQPKGRVKAPVARAGRPVARRAPASRPAVVAVRRGEHAEGASPIRLVTRASATPSTSSRAVDVDEIKSTLTRFQAAYSSLNARAARAVWPTVDERALARAFSGLKSQAIAFDRCETIVQGVKASAACQGRSTYVPRVGGDSPRTAAREWTFALKKVEDQWTIDSASFRE